MIQGQRWRLRLWHPNLCTHTVDGWVGDEAVRLTQINCHLPSPASSLIPSLGKCCSNKICPLGTSETKKKEWFICIVSPSTLTVAHCHSLRRCPAPLPPLPVKGRLLLAYIRSLQDETVVSEYKLVLTNLPKVKSLKLLLQSTFSTTLLLYILLKENRNKISLH